MIQESLEDEEYPDHIPLSGLKSEVVQAGMSCHTDTPLVKASAGFCTYSFLLICAFRHRGNKKPSKIKELKDVKKRDRRRSSNRKHYITA